MCDDMNIFCLFSFFFFFQNVTTKRIAINYYFFNEHYIVKGCKYNIITFIHTVKIDIFIMIYILIVYPNSVVLHSNSKAEPFEYVIIVH